MAKIGRRRLARELARMLQAQPGRRREVLQQAAAYLIETKQTRQADLLVKDIADELFVQAKQLHAEVSHAFDLTEATKQAIVDMLRAQTGAQTVELHTRKEPELIGGVVVRTPRHELDASVRRKLKALTAGGIK